jgi:SAM-dependent methyltransferase/Tfp pilus assembly protein PilF
MSEDLESAGRLFSRALERHLAGNWQAAEALYREALALAPDRPSILFNLGRLALDQKRFGEAESWLSEAVRAAPNDHEAWCSLGIARARQGRLPGALSDIDQAIALQPGFAAAHAERGAALAALTRLDDALESYARAMELAPDVHDWRLRFARCAALAPLAHGRAPAGLEPAVLACLRAGGIDHQQLAHAVSVLLEAKHGGIRRRLEQNGFEIATLLDSSPHDAGAWCGDPVLAASLEQVLVTDTADEAFFAGLRRGLLMLIAGPGAAGRAGVLEPLVSALACQCFLNEYVWHVTDAESALIGRLRDRAASAVDESRGAELAMLGCYVPLHKVPEVARGAGAVQSRVADPVARVLERQVRQPLQEADIAARLERRGRIQDPVSLVVRAQYEENPYPRWLTMNRNPPASYVDWIASWIAPHAPALTATAARPAILIAGCGTGKGAIALAQGCENSRCLALDLSRASLAYAARMASELGVANIEFVQGDLLDLPDDEAYDLVSCTGVLHHMADPELGLKRLLRALKPGGYLMVALYSERARRDVALAREIIAGHGLEASERGIRACRALMRTDPEHRFRALVEGDNDFYSMSMVRDLLFHVQERRYRIPEVGALLARNRLEFLGFQTPHPAIKSLYRERYPGDPAMLDLGNWDELERDHPRLFRSMYQVWARKRRSE